MAVKLYQSIQQQIMKKNSSRRVGLIRQAVLSDQSMPHTIKDLSINNINLYNEMKQINTNRDDVFARYQEIIRDLEKLVKNLQDKNLFLNEQRLRLLSENLKLMQQLQNVKENFIMADSYVKKQAALFDIVPDEDTIHEVLPRLHKKADQILQQSQFDLDIGRNGHYFSQEVSANISISDTVKSQQKTPCLINHHSLIQCRSNNNQAPLRIFYLLLLQQQGFIKKIRQLLDFCVQDDSKILLHLLPGHNNMWAQILNKFLDLVVKGQFQNQNEVIQYISQNCLIDMLFVSLLKQYLPVQNEDQDLNIGDWKNQSINHRALFQGMCNQFDLILEEDRESSIFKFYVNCHVQKSAASELSEQNLLESRTQQKQDSPSCNPIQQISLFTKPKGQFNSNSQSRQQPIFKIWFDSGRKYFRTNVSIRPQKFIGVEDEYEQADSFRMTEKSISEAVQNSVSEQEPSPLMQIDVNKRYPSRIRQKAPYKEQQYLRPNYESKNISGNNSHACSEASFI